MTERGPQSDAFYAGLKTATAQTYASFGEGSRGQTAAAKVTRVGQQRLSDYANPAELKDFIPADVLYDLAKVSRNLAVLEYLAGALDCVLIPLPEGAGAGCIIKATGEMAEDLGQATVDIGKALRDGKVSPAEGRRIVGKLHELIRSAHALAEQIKLEAGE